MKIVGQILAVFLVVTALAAAVLLIVTPLTHDGSADYPLWKILNWFMAVGVLVMLVISVLRKRALGDRDGGSDLEAARVSLVYYGAIVLTMLFFWEWFWTLNPESETGDAITSHLIYFPLMDSLYVVLGLSMGRRLWRIARGA